MPVTAQTAKQIAKITTILMSNRDTGFACSTEDKITNTEGSKPSQAPNVALDIASDMGREMFIIISSS